MNDLLLRPWVASCHETGERLSDYLDGELEGRRLARIRRHLARCARCRALLESLARTVDQLRALGSPELASFSQSTVAAVLARVEHDVGQPGP